MIKLTDQQKQELEDSNNTFEVDQKGNEIAVFYCNEDGLVFWQNEWKNISRMEDQPPFSFRVELKE
jgi:hypothetical protein